MFGYLCQLPNENKKAFPFTSLNKIIWEKSGNWDAKKKIHLPFELKNLLVISRFFSLQK